MCSHLTGGVLLFVREGVLLGQLGPLSMGQGSNGVQSDLPGGFFTFDRWTGVCLVLARPLFNISTLNEYKI